MKRSRRMLLGILLAAFLVRVAQLDARALWYDEAFAVLYAEKSFAEMWYGTVTQVQGAAADVHPLFYYSLLHGWMSAVGESVLAVRFLSVLYGVATVAVVYRLAREWMPGRSEKVALLAAGILALAPFHIAYSQETRMYAQLGFFAALLTLAYVMVEKTHFRAWWLVLILGGAAMLYTHNLAVFFGAALAAWIFVQVLRARDLRRLLQYSGAGAAILGLWLPWLTLVPSQLGKIQHAYWIGAPDALTLVQTLLTFTADFDNARFPPLLLPLALIVALLLFVLLGFEFVRGGWRDARVGLVALLAGLPPILLFAISQWLPVYLTRTLMPSFVTVVVLVAWLLARVPPIPARVLVAAMGAVALASLVFYYSYADFPRPPFRDALVYLDTHMQSGDAIVHDNKLTFFPMYYYARQDPLMQSFIADPAGAASDTLARPTQTALGLFANGLEDATHARNRVWFVMFREAREESDRAFNLEWLREQYQLVGETNFNDLELYLFEK